MRAGTTRQLFLAASLMAILSAGGAWMHSDAAESATPTNRLAEETSPYLLLHAHNPVDWYPWGPEAFEKARREGKPIFLSIGYSTCFWCHVMEREVFTNPEIAALMNRWFVNVKVDREERPDLDEIYMTATQLLTGRGGWPNSVFLTPSLRPFFAGTYFPPEDSQGRLGFPTVLTRIHEAWTTRPADVEASSKQITEAMSKVLTAAQPPAATVPGPEAAEAAVAALKKRYDSQYGGFGRAPKFPSPANLYLLAEASRRGDDEAAAMLRRTLEAMSRGGIFDQLGGGFHRYSTDRIWLTPHFEKMLYDNAQLGELLVEVGRERELPELVRAGRATLDFILGDLALPGGAFKSAIDAETDGDEGAYYTWTRDELEEVLGEDSPLLASLYGFDGAPNFEGGRYILFLSRALEEAAADREASPREFAAHIDGPRWRLLDRRRQREHPLVDDKVLTDWTGMTIAALARAGDLLDEPRYLAAASRAADFLLRQLRDDEGRLLHTWRGGHAKLPAFLDDYAFFVRGLLALDAATGEPRWLSAAARLSDEMEERLRIPAGGYHLNARAGVSGPRRGRSACLFPRSHRVSPGRPDPGTGGLEMARRGVPRHHRQRRSTRPRHGGGSARGLPWRRLLAAVHPGDQDR